MLENLNAKTNANGIMQSPKRLNLWSFLSLAGLFTASLLTGCQTDKSCCAAPEESPAAATLSAPATPVTPATTVTAAMPASTTAAKATSTPGTIRIKAGSSEPLKDSEGNTWLPDQGFVEGDTTERPDLQIANTKNPAIYLSERYSMTSFSYPLPNGRYIVKLHFAETFEGITGPGERVFSFNVEGKEFKDFDVWVKAGGPLRAYVETVPTVITDGKLDITFTPNIENPQINGIEIIPES